MAGQSKGIFKERISPFLASKMDEVKVRLGEDSQTYRSLVLQYAKDQREELVDLTQERRRHYEAEVLRDTLGNELKGVERLYRRTALIEPSTVCAAHCRWCLRGQYDLATLKTQEIQTAAKFFGSAEVRDDLREVLITGGDPFMVRVLLEYTIDQIAIHAPNIEVVRIGTRVFTQDPARIDASLLNALRKRPNLRIEVGTNINHPIELWPESVEAMRKVTDLGIRIYNQHPLLKGVNDDLATLLELYDGLRSNAIEAHYLFHCIPMRGMQHHRTTVARGLELVRQLVSSGSFSGRAKPSYAAMTDVGKVTFYEGTIVDRRGHEILLRTGYLVSDRLKWNPTWTMPPSAEVDAEGRLRVWYLDVD